MVLALVGGCGRGVGVSGAGWVVKLLDAAWWLPPLVVAGWCGWVAVVGRVRLWFENCIVDASIFVVKLVRAHGGCLGTRSR
jgi:hypothetical protein